MVSLSHLAGDTDWADECMEKKPLIINKLMLLLTTPLDPVRIAASYPDCHRLNTLNLLEFVILTRQLIEAIPHR
jgi:hypothetical protein